jgi:hypothetical protein
MLYQAWFAGVQADVGGYGRRRWSIETGCRVRAALGTEKMVIDAIVVKFAEEANGTAYRDHRLGHRRGNVGHHAASTRGGRHRA